MLWNYQQQTAISASSVESTEFTELSVLCVMVKGHHLSLAIETWSATVSGQNRSGLKAGHFKGKKRYFGELHGKQQSPCLRKCDCFDLLLDF